MPKDKSKSRYQKSERVFTAVSENGALKPLTEKHLIKRKELTITDSLSIVSQMYGLFKFQNQEQVDKII